MTLSIFVTVDGGFSEWSPWTLCTKSCDGGTRERNRTCSHPFPQYGGSVCYGEYLAKEMCGVGFCPGKSRCTVLSQIEAAFDYKLHFFSTDNNRSRGFYSRK